MHIARVSFGNTDDLSDDHAVIVVNCLTAQFKPDADVHEGEQVTLYDMKRNIEAPGVITHIDQQTGIAEVAVARKDAKTLRVVNEGLGSPTAALPDVIKQPWHKKSAFGATAALIATGFLAIFGWYWQPMLTLFVLDNLDMGSLFSAFGGQDAVADYQRMILLIWMVLLLPLVAIWLCRAHWRNNGDLVTGVFGVVLTSLAGSIFSLFASVWLFIHVMVPLGGFDDDESFDAFESASDASLTYAQFEDGMQLTLWLILTAGFLVTFIVASQGAFPGRSANRKR